MNLFSVCLPCERLQAFDGGRKWGDHDRCPNCNELMDVYTEAGVKNENNRRWFDGKEPLRVGAPQ